MVAEGSDGASGRGRPGLHQRRRHQRRRVERWIFRHQERPRRGAVVADGEGDGASRRGRPGLQRRLAINASGIASDIPRSRAAARRRCCGRRRGRRRTSAPILGKAWSDTQAVAINNLGDIIGYGEYQGGHYGFLLNPIAGAALSATPVPELSTGRCCSSASPASALRATAARRRPYRGNLRATPW